MLSKAEKREVTKKGKLKIFNFSFLDANRLVFKI